MPAGRRRSGKSTRKKLRSPGQPPVWQRENLCRFWRSIAMEVSSEEAAVFSGVSAPVGVRWFRSSGGMPPAQSASSSRSPAGRSLTFAEREEIALERARGSGIRAIARRLGRSPGTIPREIRRNSATRSGNFGYCAINAQRHAERPGPGRLVMNPALRDYVQEVVRHDRHARRHRLRRARRALDGAMARPSTEPTPGGRLEPRADRAAFEDRLSEGPRDAHQPRGDLPGALHSGANSQPACAPDAPCECPGNAPAAGVKPSSRGR